MAEGDIQDRVAKARASGYSEDEIRQQLAPQRTKAMEAGFTPEEVDQHLGLQPAEKQSIPTAFLGRLQKWRNQTDVIDRFADAATKAGKEGWGEGDVGFEKGSEVEQFFDKHYMTGGTGFAGAGPLRWAQEAALRPAAMLVDGISRATRAAAYGIGGGVAQIAKEFGENEAQADRLKRDVGGGLDFAAQVAPMLHMGTGSFTRLRKTADGKLFDEPIGGVPEKADFKAATSSLTGGQEAPHVDAKLLQLWVEKGITPAETATAAAEDPVLLQKLLSKGEDLPEEAGGAKKPQLPAERETTEPAKGGGGKEPPPEEGTPLGTPGEEPKRITGATDMPGEGGWDVESASALIDRRLSIGEADPERKWTWERAYTATVDKLFSLSKAAGLIEEGGKDLATNEHFYKLARLYAGWSAKAQDMLQGKGVFDFFSHKTTFDSLKDVLAEVKSDLEGFRRFAVAARAAELEARGIESGFPMGAARTVVEGTKKKYAPTFRKLVDYQNQVAQYLKDSGVLNERGYRFMTDANQLYIPFHRVLNEEGLGIAGIGGDLQARQVIHALTGSELRVIDPLESVIKNTYLMVAMAEKNRVGQMLVRALEGASEGAITELTPSQGFKQRPGGQAGLLPGADKQKLLESGRGELTDFFRPEEQPKGASPQAEAINDFLKGHGAKEVPPEVSEALAAVADPNRPGTISVFENGKQRTYRVDPDIARAMKNLDAETMDLVTKLLAKPTSTLRAGAVLNIAFDIRHIFRDFIYAFTTFKNESGTGLAERTFTPMDVAKGLWGQIVKDDVYTAWIRGGGGNVSLVSLDRVYLQKNLEKLTTDGGLFTRTWNLVTSPETTWLQAGGYVLGTPFKAFSQYVIHPLQLATEIATSASHHGAFRKAYASLAPEGEAGAAGALKRKGEVALRDAMPQEMQNADMRPRPGVSSADATKAYTDGVFRPLSDTAEKKRNLDAAWISRDTAVDAARIGSQMRSLNMISAFLNIKIQDTDRIARALVSGTGAERASAALRIGIGITMPSVILWSVNHEDSRYKELHDGDKDHNWIFLTDKWETVPPELATNRPEDQKRIVNGQYQVNNGNIFRVPKPFNAGVLFGSGVERTLEAFKAGNPEAFKGYLHALQEATVGDLVPTAITPFVEQAMNRRLFSGQTLIPSHLEKQLPEYQFAPYTTETSKMLGHYISAFPGVSSWRLDQNAPLAGGVARALSSPILIENYLRGWTGTLGRGVFDTIDLGLRKSGLVMDPPKPVGTLSDIPIIGAFTVRYPTASPASIQDFYDHYATNKRYFDTWNVKAEEGDTAAMARIEKLGGSDIFVQLDDIKTALNEHNQLIQFIYKQVAQKEKNPAEARQLIDGTYFAMLRIGQLGKKILSDMDKGKHDETPQ